MSRRDRRARATGRLGMQRGERYALIPREVMESDAYRALPAWTTRVLLALGVQYYGHRNGSLALPLAEARTLGVTTSAQLYGGLRLLETVDLIACTRRGHLVGGRQLATLYAVTWRAIDEPASGVTYDPGISVSPMPTHAWSQWIRPADWTHRVRMIVTRARGQRSHESPYATRAASQREESAAHSVRGQDGRHRSQRGESGSHDPAHSVCEASKISARGRSGSRSGSPSAPAPSPIPGPGGPGATLRMLVMHGHTLAAERQTAALAYWLLSLGEVPPSRWAA